MACRKGGRVFVLAHVNEVKEGVRGLLWWHGSCRCDFLCLENRPPSIRELARKAKISTTYASKIIKEIKETGHIVPVSILKKERADKSPYKGVGAQCLCCGDQQVLLDLRKEDDSDVCGQFAPKVHT